MAIRSFGSASLENIRAFELANDIQLPDDYVDFLAKYNGGVVETIENKVNVKSLGEDIHIDVLFGVRTKDPELSVELWLNDYRGDMPQDTIVIGDSYEHGLLILLCSGEDTGVYYWDHTHEFASTTSEGNTYFIAETFTDFYKNLQ